MGGGDYIYSLYSIVFETRCVVKLCLCYRVADWGKRQGPLGLPSYQVVALESQAGFITQHTHVVQLPGRSPAVVCAVSRGLCPKGMYWHTLAFLRPSVLYLSRNTVWSGCLCLPCLRYSKYYRCSNPKEDLDTRIIKNRFWGWIQVAIRTTASNANPMLTIFVPNNNICFWENIYQFCVHLFKLVS